VLEGSSAAGAAYPASHGEVLMHSAVRQRVHALLGSLSLRGRWLGVLDDLPSPEAMAEGGLDWLLKEFPWAYGRTIITTRAAAWTDEEALSVAFDVVDEGDEQCRCAECGEHPPALFKGTKCGDCKEVYYCCRACQQKAWKAHKPLCLRRVADRRSVADIVGLQLGSFAEEEACSWVKVKVPQWAGDDEGILELVRHLKCYPLTVALAAEHARCDKTATPGKYLEMLKLAGHTRAKGPTTMENYPECFPDVVKLSLDTILLSDKAYGEDAGQALREMALMDMVSIPLDLLGADEKKAVVLLQEHSLVTVDEKGGAAMNELTQLVVLDQLTEKSQRPALVAALAAKLAVKLGKFTHEKPSTHSIGLRYARHAGAVAAQARVWGVMSVDRPGIAEGGSSMHTGRGGGGADGVVLDNIRAMCQQAGFFFQHVSAQPREALRLHEMALESAMAEHGCDHRRVASSHTDIGNVYQAQGKHEEALVQHYKSLEIKIRVKCDSLDVAKSHNNIGVVYGSQGDYHHALLQHQKSLEIKALVLGCEHPELAISYNNIGNVYQRQGDYGNALLQHQKSIGIKIPVFGAYSLQVAGAYNNIGNVHCSQGDYEGALVQHKKSLEIKIRVLGSEHPLVAESYHNIGMAYEAQGNNLALEQYQKSLEIKIQVYGLDHPLIADSKYNIGRVYEERNEMDAALELFLECQVIYSKVHGPQDCRTIMAANAAQRASRCVEESV